MDDATCCQYFPTALKGITQKQFNGLPNESITSFLQLVELHTSLQASGKGRQAFTLQRFNKKKVRT